MVLVKFGLRGLGIGDWGLGPIPNPQSPIPNPQSPIWGLGIGDWGLGPIPNPQSPIPIKQYSSNPKPNLSYYILLILSFYLFLLT
jgi:hypothetical protein